MSNTLSFMTPTTTSSSPSLAQALEQVNRTREAMIFEQIGQPAVVLLPLDEYNSMQEILHLFNTRANTKHLLESLDQMDNGEVVTKELIK